MNDKKLTVEFWGVRGTLPVPGKDSLHFGGNTNCVTLSIPGNELFIFDAGTGIKALSNFLVKQKIHPVRAKIFITHPHWDHISTIPYFTPFYIKGNEFEIMSPCDDHTTVEHLIFSQMDSIHFPVTINEFQAALSFRKLKEETLNFNDVQIQTKKLNHPGNCLGYKVIYNQKSVCYITDNELYNETSPKYNQENYQDFIRFISDTDVLIIDTTYTDEQYKVKENWGHSCVSKVVETANQARVKRLCLYHHDPSQMDKDIENKLQHARSLLNKLNSKTICDAPREGDKITI